MVGVRLLAEPFAARRLFGAVGIALVVVLLGSSIRYDLGRVIGYDQAGYPVTGIQVWVRDGYIRTVYPVAP